MTFGLLKEMSLNLGLCMNLVPKVLFFFFFCFIFSVMNLYFFNLNLNVTNFLALLLVEAPSV